MIKISKRTINFVILIFGLIFLFAFQETNIKTISNTIKIFLESVLPSLFPFIIFTNIIINSELITNITSIFKKNSYLISVIIIGFLCGYPMAAKIAYKYYQEGFLSKKQVDFLMSFTNNCNPIFILSTIGVCVFKNINIGIILCISHYLSSILIGIIYFTHNIIHKNIEKSNSFSNNCIKKLHKSIFEIVDDSIKNSFLVIGNIFAFIAIFNMIFKIIEKILLKFNISKNIIYILSCMFEVTDGCRLLYLNSTFNFNILLSFISFALGFSGLSIIFQIYSCIYKSKIKVFHIIKFKFLQGILSFIITFIILNVKNNITTGENVLSLKKYNSSSYFIIFACLLFLIIYAIKKVTQK